MLSLILSQIGRHAKEYFKTRALPKAITVLGFVAVFGFVMLGLYELLRTGLAFIASNVYFGNAVSLYLYEMILLVIVALSVATALIEGTFSLFRNTNEQWIMATPGYTRIPDMVLVETILGGAFLPLLVLAIPTLLAMEQVYHMGILGIVCGLCAVLFLVAASITGTFILFFVIAMLYAHIRFLRLSYVLSTILVLLVLIGGIIWQNVGGEGTLLLFPDYTSSAHGAQVHTVIEHFAFIPSHPAALVLFNAQQGDIHGALFETLLLGVLAIALYGIYRLLSGWYLRIWQVLQGEPDSFSERHASKKPEPFPRYLHGALGALFEKEWLMIVRTGRDFMWLLFMLFLWLLQIGIDILVKKSTAGASITTFPLIIQALEVGVIAYFLGAFTLRFAFPTFSTEQGTAWIIQGSPVSLARIYSGKLIFFCSFFGVLSIIVALLHSYLLHLSVGESVSLLIVSCVMGITITACSMMLGILFPNFETTDPQALSTSLPGLTLVFLVLIYGAVGSFAFLSLLTTGDMTQVALFIFISLVTVGASISTSLRKLQTFEFGILS